MKHKNLCAAFAAATAASLILSSCGSSKTVDVESIDESDQYGLTESGVPVVEQTLTLRFGGSKNSLAPDYEDMVLVQQWEKDTNVHIEWENLPDTVYSEKKNLMLASDDLPDVLFNSGLTDQELVVNGQNGVILPLEDLIDQHAPTLKAILDKRPDIRSAITASDGHIYTLPSVEELGIVPYPNFLYINKTWLDQLGLPMPETIEEYHDALLAFKQNDMNGNGKADEIPLSFRTDSFCANPYDLLLAAGGQPDNGDHRIVRDGKVEFTANTPEYRKGVETLSQWYQEGLIDPESFAQDDVTYLSKGKSDPQILGSFFWWELKEVVGEENMDDYEMVGVLTGVDGTKKTAIANNQEISRGAMVITSANKYPVATMRWADYLFDPVMSAQSNWGPIGVTLQYDDSGMLVQIPTEPGESEGERRIGVAPGGPKITTVEDFETVVAPEPRAAERQELVAQYYAPYAANDAYPPVMLSIEELDATAYVLNDINEMVKEKFATWIVDGSIDQQWDDYLAQLETLGIDEVVSTYQQAYDRFESAQ